MLVSGFTSLTGLESITSLADPSVFAIDMLIVQLERKAINEMFIIGFIMALLSDISIILTRVSIQLPQEG